MTDTTADTNGFRSVVINGTLTDAHGEMWLQDTATGWRREKDGYFWAFNPTNTDNPYGTKAHTVGQVATMRSKQCCRN